MSVSAVLWYNMAISQGTNHKFVYWGNAAI